MLGITTATNVTEATTGAAESRLNVDIVDELTSRTCTSDRSARAKSTHGIALCRVPIPLAEEIGLKWPSVLVVSQI